MVEYWAWENTLEKSLCEEIIASFKSDKATTGTIGGNNHVSTSTYRKSELNWLPQNCLIENILFEHGVAANQRAGWNFDVNAVEQVQLARYPVGGHYKLHTDSQITDYPRKITVIAILSDPTTYEGGDLVLGREDAPPMAKSQGTIVAFPSTHQHLVTPLLSGVRFSATMWIHGPNWK